MRLPYRLSDHARQSIEQRRIPLGVVESVLENPDQIVEEREGRKAYQSKVRLDDRLYLIRIIVVDTISPLLVVTAYRTTRIAKYWSDR